MANHIIIRHGINIPSVDYLKEYELGIVSDSRQIVTNINSEIIPLSIGKNYKKEDGTFSGEIFNDYTYNAASGISSHAEGTHTTASGNYSHTEGDSTIASGNYSHTEGYYTTASGAASHAENDHTVASGSSSHAEGSGTKAIGTSSHAEGNSTTASTNYSHAEGGSTTASGNVSHAEGYYTAASGNMSHAEGYHTIASGEDSHAENCYTTANGLSSHAEGLGTTASAYCAHAEGHYTIASGYCSHAEGRYNAPGTNQNANTYSATNNAFMIGNGPSPQTRSNAFRITFAGATYGLSAFNSSGADYAEYFEWADGNPNAEDRIGYFVTFDGANTIRKANVNDEILGVVSGTAGVIGDSYDDNWCGMYARDNFGRLQYEDVTTEAGVEKHIKCNPEYDPTIEYIPRSQRKEWDCIGLIGKLYVRDDGTCTPGGKCKCGANGIATASIDGGYRVMERINDNIIRIFVK